MKYGEEAVVAGCGILVLGQAASDINEGVFRMQGSANLPHSVVQDIGCFRNRSEICTGISQRE
jgi:hypothetical protein